MSTTDKILNELKTINPEWDSIIYDFYEEDKKVPKEDEEILKTFSRFIDAFVQEVKEKGISQEKAFEIYKNLKCSQVINVFAFAQLRLFWACIPINELEKQDYYAVEQVLDIIWNQYVLRFSGKELYKRQYPITVQEFQELCKALDRFVDDCVQKQLSAKAIYTRLQSEADLAPNVCQYLVDKFEQDWTELKLNYIIKQLRALREKD